jgi:hypothetical protein
VIDGRCGERLPAADLALMICPEASSAKNSMAAVSVDDSTVCVLILRLNSSCIRSIALIGLASRTRAFACPRQGLVKARPQERCP